jgi:hypothetical protein
MRRARRYSRPTNDKKVIHVEGAAGDRVMDRISQLPEACEHLTTGSRSMIVVYV